MNFGLMSTEEACKGAETKGAEEGSTVKGLLCN
jgi:hypothetical protein